MVAYQISSTDETLKTKGLQKALENHKNLYAIQDYFLFLTNENNSKNKNHQHVLMLFLLITQVFFTA